MARVFIDDRWLKTAEDGTPPSASATKALANAKDPMRAKVPKKWRTSLYGTGKRWRCRWYVLDDDGTKQQKSRAFDMLGDAEEFAAALEDDVRRGRYIDPDGGDKMFSKVADLWIDTKIDVKESTLLRYKRELRVYIKPKWGDKMLREITRGDLQRWVNSLTVGNYPAELPNERSPRPLAARSIRNIVKVVMAGILDYAVENKWILDNPARSVKLPKAVVKDDDMVFLTIGEVEAIAKAATSIGRDMDGLLVRFQAAVGTRINEALALQVQDLNLKKGTARIRRTWTRNLDNKRELGTPKNGEARTVAIPDFLIEPLQKQVAGCKKDDFVFRAPRGGAIDDGNWRTRIWSKVMDNLGMKDEGVTIHSLRHTYASIAIANGADVKTLQKQLGHATATMTLDIYAALWPDKLDSVAHAVSQAWQEHNAKPKNEQGTEDEIDQPKKAEAETKKAEAKKTGKGKTDKPPVELEQAA
ncbi:tyrosine-type recombinase/integrase [Bifidobacterium platyrrhinorum]|uniref:Tyrosine-type recombinase/integrase n=1 Tax=Bifidobacterium platyrrhinorum TaxID=2661628 RepID=A0A6L9SSG9_9BIFI|nr:site-specific integrase [Bifidobacterium platyrrhinorum]NEG54743.1 tyrosine-type recombinase/integrase [Bifidobacterium platyrrhinorum]